MTITQSQSQSTARLLGDVEAHMAALPVRPGTPQAEAVAQVRSLMVNVRHGNVANDLSGVDGLSHRFSGHAANAVARLVAEAYRVRADAILASARAAEADEAASLVPHPSVARSTDDLVLAAQIAISRSQDWVSLGEYSPPLSAVFAELHRRGLWLVADLLRDRSVLHYGS